MNAIRLSRPAVLVTATALLCVPAVAEGTPPAPQTSVTLAPTQTEDGGILAPVQGRPTFGLESAGAPVDGLPPTRTNVDLVGKLELTAPFGDVRPEQIADVSAKGDFAYLNSWQSPVPRPGAPAGSCERGGVFVVDISDPANPKQVTFVPSSPGSYPGEGSQVISINTPAFAGDVLTVNNEACAKTAADGDATTRKGGISLIDVTNPRSPAKLADGVGDVTPSGAVPGVKDSPVHLSHSAFSWQVEGDPATNADNKAYTVFVDNEEQGGEDVDILDITNPRAPVFINEFSLNGPAGGSSGFGDNVLLHDMVVEKIGNRYMLLASYWDGGYVQVDLTDPSDPTPTVTSDSDFLVNDPLFPAFSPPEGNAHQAEYSHDRQLVVAADEDFSPYRLITDIDNVPREFPFGVAVNPAGQFLPQHFPDVGDPLAGDTRFIGDGCTAATVPAPQAGETVAVAERGTCDFDTKAGNAEAAGYDAILIFNNVLGTAPRCDAVNLNMAFDGTPAVTIKALLIPRSIGFEIINAFDPATYRCVANDPTSTPTPAPNRAGVPVDFSARFDGWGYMHLFDASTMVELDAWAVDEAVDERFALDFGDLSVHETANDPETNLAYVSYYRAGFRVVRFTRSGGLEEVGRFIDTRGNNLWGVHQMTADDGSRLILASDRDYGLYIFRYTGPGAIGPRQIPQPGPAAGRCANVQAGTAGADGLMGTRFGDRLVGGAGRDRLTGLDGEDCLFGQGGNDSATGDRGRDLVAGGSGRDRLFGDSGRDDVRGGTGADHLRGGAGHDRLTGGAGNDRMDGGSNEDRMVGGAGKDSMRGSAGNDRLIGGSGKDHINVGTARNVALGGSGNDRIFAANSRRDRISCGKGNDRVRADATDRVSRNCETVHRID